MSSAKMIDAHFHVWELEKFPEYQFPTPEFPQMMRNFTIEDFESAVAPTPVDAAVFVQVANDCHAEIEWLCEMAKTHKIIKGVVGGLTLNKGFDTLSNEIEALHKYPQFVGARYVLNYKDADTYLTDPATRVGLGILQSRRLTFDLVLYPRLIKQAIQVARDYPQLKLMVDHCAKPPMGADNDAGWAEDLKMLASYQNVYCKLSGVGMKQRWTPDDIRPYVQNIIDWFGAKRIVFGSDWPVCLQNADSYKSVFEATEAALPADLTANNYQRIFHDNAVNFYNLDHIFASPE